MITVHVTGPSEKAKLVKKVSRYIGLSADLVDRANLKIPPEIFRKNLLAKERRVIGRFDARAGRTLDAPYALAGCLVDPQHVRGGVGPHPVKHLHVKRIVKQQR